MSNTLASRIEKAYLAYRITCLINGKCYIGITTRQPSQRWSSHVWSARNNPSTGIAAAIRKHGAENFSMEVVACAFSFEALLQLESDLIAQEGTISPLGYNLTTGGVGTRGYVRSQKWRRQHSERMKQKRWTEERRAQMREKFKGRIFSPEWKAKIAAAKKGQGPSPQQAAAHSLIMRGRKKPPRSPEHIAKIAANARLQWARIRELNPDANGLGQHVGRHRALRRGE